MEVKFDVNNISGKRRADLMKQGVSSERFSTEQNVSGKNVKGSKPVKTNYKIGDMVEFRKKVSQVVEVSEKKGVKITKAKGEISKWIPFNRIKMVDPEED